MTEIFRTENWSFPLKDGNQAPYDPHRDVKALAKAEGGYYPLGRRGLWHGGIHFDEATGLISDKREISCLADGEVIAYRIDERYPASSFEGRSAVFSSGFVLVRHRLQPPPLTGISYAPPAPTLTVYSLYMHLLDWAGYLTSSGLRRPTFWGGGVYRVKDSAQDKTLGLRIRAAPKDHPDHGVILAVLPRGTTVMTKAASAADKWLEVVSVSPEIEGLAPSTGWVFKPEMTALGTDRYLIGNAAKDAPVEQMTGVNVRATANANANPLGLLPIGTSLKISNVGAVGKFRKLLKIVSGKCVPPLAIDENGHLPGFVWLDALEANREPEAKDRVVVLDEPIRIKAGDLIGHVGKYQELSEDIARNLLHLEVFSCEDVPDFIARSREYAACLPADQRTLLKLYKGSSRVVPHREDINTDNPPSINEPGAVIGAPVILPVGLLESLPPESKLSITETVPGTTISYTRRWWRLDDHLPNESGETVSGWVLEQDLLTTRHSPWEWEGYECITETSRNADNLAHHLSSLADLPLEQRRHYQALASSAGKGPIRSRLHTLLNIGENEHLGHEEIRAARDKPWHAQAIGRLITHYESEWFWNPQKWDELDALWDHTGRVRPEQWQISKARIKKLSWWAELAGLHGISLEGKAWHFHIITIMMNFHNYKIITHQKPGQITFNAEGNDIPGSPYYSRHIHWPGNDLSGVTIGRGYDMGTRSQSEIHNHMLAAGIPHVQASRLAEAAGLKGSQAAQFVNNYRTSIGDITHQQEQALFDLIYPFYIDRAIANYNKWTENLAGRQPWESLHPIIRDILVDFVYQGFTAGPNPMKAGMKNNFSELISYIENTPAISQYEPGRQRANYLRKYQQ
ncbi:pesticin C-terminus-like muramidase [Pseudomonas sp. MWU12-2345]|uniref:pesticin C-terminus-like muramidase n=1 Tax=Pseudomonas sp. MWU12-2345 TaxID=2928689 RepID=UPI00200DFCAC|nr:pesticin C-terminus-like muramidase [Pseudomonas sp. MWU12-2345]